MTNGPSSLSRTAISVTTSTITFSRLLEPFIGAWPVWTTSRNQRSQARSKRKTSALLLTVRFVRGSGGAPRSYAPTFVAGNCRNRAMRRYLPFATISAEDVASPKSICEWAKSGQGRTFTNRQFCERASPMLDYFIATMACAENDVLNVFGCGR